MNYFKNPLPITRIGDPYVLKVGVDYYCYPTAPMLGDTGYKVWHSADAINWEYRGMALAIGEDSWAYKDFWAPEVVQHNDKFYMFYTARWKHTKTLRIGVAISDAPTGPFVDYNKAPMFDFGYAAIDAHVLFDGGKAYLYYSRDCSENLVNGLRESHIYVVELANDLCSTIGNPILLLKPEQEWELMPGPNRVWNEGATVLKKGELYYLMYSGNFYQSRYYGIGYATSSSPIGPFEKYALNPIVSTAHDTRAISGPGHNCVYLSPDETELWAAYHTHTDPQNPGDDRQIAVDRIGFRADGTLYANAPTNTPQPMPNGVGGVTNIAKSALLEVCGTTGGRNAEALRDGEIGMYYKFQKYEWIGDGNSTIRFSWKLPQTVESIWIYGSAVGERNNGEWAVRMSNGAEFSNVHTSRVAGEAWHAKVDATVEWIEIVASSASTVGLSEVVIMGELKESVRRF